MSTDERQEKKSPGDESDAVIKRTYIESTKRQRAYWTSLMLAEKKRTRDGTLNLSEWIIRQLPNPDEGDDAERYN